MPVKMHRAGPGRRLAFCKLEEWSRPENQELQADPAWRPSQKTLRCVTRKPSPQCTTLSCMALQVPLGSPSSFPRAPGPRPQSGLHPESLGQASELEVVTEGPQQSSPPPAGPMGPQRGLAVCADDMLGPRLSLLMLLASPR